MPARRCLAFPWILIAACFVGLCEAGPMEDTKELVRIAELEIDPARLDAYTVALKEEIATSIAVEPGVLSLYAVAVKDHPNQIRILERYADQAAYERHIQSPHFQKYKSETQTMVRSLRLIETSTIVLGAKKDRR
jgi:quinol monooxygenase YgiN